MLRIVYEESLVSDIGRACLMDVGYKSRWWARCNHVCDKFGLWERVNVVVVVYPLPLLVGGVRCSRLWSTSQLLRPSGQQCSHSGGVCPQIQGRQCGAYVGAVEEMMCVVCVDVTEGA